MHAGFSSRWMGYRKGVTYYVDSTIDLCEASLANMIHAPELPDYLLRLRRRRRRGRGPPGLERGGTWSRHVGGRWMTSLVVASLEYRPI